MTDDTVRVPREPTEEIIAAICDEWFYEWRGSMCEDTCRKDARDMYLAMLAAAPRSEAEKD